MTIRYIKMTFRGTTPLLLNNPQTADRFNPLAREMKKINDKKTRRTDDDYKELGRLEVESKIYWDDLIGVYAPANWLYAAIPMTAFKTVKIGKAAMRGGLFISPGREKCKLSYEGMETVKKLGDVVNNPRFVHRMILPQQAVRIAKNFPIFHKWSFTSELEFDDEVIDFEGMGRVINQVAKYGGFGDFRPTFGRCTVEIIDHE